MKTNTFGKKLAVILVIAAMIFTFGMMSFESAHAEEAHKATVGKTLKVDEGVFRPAFTFSFTAEPGDAVAAADNNGTNIYAGVEGAVTIADIAFDETAAVTDKKTAEETKTADVTVDTAKFTKPGIYRYTVKETNGAYPGMAYDSAAKTLDVYIVQGAKGLEVLGYQFVDPDTNKKSEGNEGNDADGQFVNSYVHGNDTNQLHNITVEKKIDGNMADKNAEFEFTVEVDKKDNDADVFTVVDAAGNKTALKKDSTTLKLKGGQNFKVEGLTAGDELKITETDYTADGYTTKVEGLKDGKIDGSKDATVTFTNTKNTDTPTGIFFHYAPYIALVAVAAALILLSKKRKTDR